jgi:thiamine-monophosphate kinase
VKLDEFAIIKNYFQKAHHQRSDVIVDSGDDCAVLSPPAGQELLMTIDTMVVGRHFLPSIDPADLAYKAVAVSLSDVASMGGEPAWMLATLSIEVAEDLWLKRFAEGLFAILQEFGVAMVGGDLTRGPLSITTQITGFIPKGHAILRSGAKVGDKIFVSGTLGDAGLALADQLGKLTLDSTTKLSVYPKLLRPVPRVAEGLALRNVASAAIDISDGLAADLSHILKQSGVGAKLFVDSLPLSGALQALPLDQARQLALSAGDDYELCFTVTPEQAAKIKRLIPSATYVGDIVAKSGIEFFTNDGKVYHSDSSGYLHF